MKSGFTVNQQFIDALKDPETRDRTESLVRGKPRGIQPGQKLSDATRARMSAAKQGVPKTAEHREHMSQTHRLRQQLRARIRKEQPELSEDQVWQQVREQLHGLHQ